MKRVLIVTLLGAVLGACAAPGPTSPGSAELQQQRRAAILARQDWALRGRVGVSDGQEGGSARIRWETGTDGYELWIYAPLGQGTWRLSGDGQGAELAGPEGTFTGPDANTLLIRHLGWHLPVESLTYWVRGLAAPKTLAEVNYTDEGRLAVIEQAGWRVEFTEWADYQPFDMPRRIEAVQDPYKVKLVILDWALREGQR